MTDTPKTRPRRGAGRVAFLARLEQFKNLLAAGHEQRTIYDDFEGQLGISYSQFNRYVVRYITGAKENEHQRKGSEQNSSPKPLQPPTGNERSQTGGSDSAGNTSSSKRSGLFQHNPNSGNDRKDLI